MAEIDDYEARARLTALGWTIEPFMAWPEAECIPAIAWLAPGAWDRDSAPNKLWERGWDDPLPPIPDEVLETLA
jgi:hypothetical protein